MEAKGQSSRPYAQSWFVWQDKLAFFHLHSACVWVIGDQKAAAGDLLVEHFEAAFPRCGYERRGGAWLSDGNDIGGMDGL